MRAIDIKAFVVRVLLMPAGLFARLSVGTAAGIWAALILTGGMDRPVYATMRAAMPPNYWAVLFALIAVFEFSSLFARCNNRCLPALLGFIACVWVFVVASMMLSVASPTAGIAGEAVVAIQASWLFLRRAILSDIPHGKH